MVQMERTKMARIRDVVQIGRTKMTPPQDRSIPRRMKCIGTSMEHP